VAASAFTMLMRVERGASANYRHMASARQMLYAGLAQAVADLESDLGSDWYPQWGSTWTWTNGTHSVTIPPEVLGSIDRTVNDETKSNPARILSAEALAYVPSSLHSNVMTAEPEWLEMNIGGTNIIGRYAYVAANVSGLLDANEVNAPSGDRGIGASPGEIRLSPVLTTDLTAVNTFTNDRSRDLRYETVKELRTRNSAVDSFKLTHFETFSYAPDMLQPDGVTPKVYIGGTADQLRSNKTAIVAAFIKCGIPMWDPMVEPISNLTCSSNAAEQAYRALVDYVDSDSVPEGASDQEQFARPMSEAVPVPVYFYVQTTYDYNDDDPSPGQRHHYLQTKIETCFSYPFVRTTGETQFQASVTLVSIPLATMPLLWTPLMPAGVMPSQTISVNPVAGPQAFVVQWTPPPFECVTDRADGMPSIDYWLRCSTQVDDSKSRPVQAMAPFDLHIQESFTGPLQVSTNWAEAIDPLVSWDGFNLRQWRPYHDVDLNGCAQDEGLPLDQLSDPMSPGFLSGYPPPTPPSATLRGSLAEFCLLSSNGIDKVFKTLTDGSKLGDGTNYWDSLVNQCRFHVANTNLQSVGELGFLPLGRWFSVNLYDHGHAVTYDMVPSGAGKGYHPVLDYFTLRDPAAGATRGLVHAASAYSNVHATVMNQMPINEWKGAGANRVSAAADIVDLAKWYYDRCGGVTKLSELAWIWSGVPHLGNQGGALPAGTDPANVLSRITGGDFGELERESVIRNTAQLYTTRQQLFTIILRADSFSAKYGFQDLKRGNVMSTAQAVAQIWRDPMPNADGRHPCFVRLFKILPP
jgi:hypothetical protein